MKSVKDIVLDGLKYFRQELLSSTPTDGDTKHALSLDGAYDLQSQISQLNQNNVASISRSGTTFTAKNGNGTQLFTFTQQDNNTTTGTTYAASNVPNNTTFATNGSVKNVHDKFNAMTSLTISNKNSKLSFYGAAATKYGKIVHYYIYFQVNTTINGSEMICRIQNAIPTMGMMRVGVRLNGYFGYSIEMNNPHADVYVSNLIGSISAGSVYCCASGVYTTNA